MRRISGLFKFSLVSLKQLKLISVYRDLNL